VVWVGSDDVHIITIDSSEDDHNDHNDRNSKFNTSGDSNSLLIESLDSSSFHPVFRLTKAWTGYVVLNSGDSNTFLNSGAIAEHEKPMPVVCTDEGQSKRLVAWQKKVREEMPMRQKRVREEEIRQKWVREEEMRQDEVRQKRDVREAGKQDEEAEGKVKQDDVKQDDGIHEREGEEEEQQAPSGGEEKSDDSDSSSAESYEGDEAEAG
jgi:hypothetical protein